MTKRMLICKKWFLLIVVFFVLVYAVFLSLSLEWGAVLWDEAPHLSGGILLGIYRRVLFMRLCWTF